MNTLMGKGASVSMNIPKLVSRNIEKDALQNKTPVYGFEKQYSDEPMYKSKHILARIHERYCFVTAK